MSKKQKTEEKEKTVIYSSDEDEDTIEVSESESVGYDEVEDTMECTYNKYKALEEKYKSAVKDLDFFKSIILNLDLIKETVEVAREKYKSQQETEDKKKMSDFVIEVWESYVKELKNKSKI